MSSARKNVDNYFSVPRPVRPEHDFRFQLIDYVQSALLKSVEATRHAHEEMITSGAFEKLCKSTSRLVRNALGPMEFGADAPPVYSRIVSSYESAYCSIENVLFESMPGWEVNATLFIPKSKAPHRCIVMPVGVSGKHASIYEVAARALARVGFITAIFDPPSPFGEKSVGNDHFIDGARECLLGTTPLRHAVRDALRIIDYLESRKDTNLCNGVAVTGLGHGGLVSLYTALFDRRVQCVGLCCCISEIIYHPLGDMYCTAPEGLWIGKIRDGIDNPDLVRALLPVPLLYMAGSRDEVFSEANSDRVSKLLEKTYETGGVPDRFRYFKDDCGHDYSLRQVQEFARWIKCWLRDEAKDDPPLFSTEDFPPLERETVLCHPSQAVNIHSLAIDEARRLESSRRSTVGRDGLAELVESLVGRPDGKAVLSLSDAQQIWTQDYREALVKLDEFEIPASILTPRSETDSPQWIIYLGEGGRREALEQGGQAQQLSLMLDRTEAAQHPAIVAIDLPGWGECSPSVTPYSLSPWASMPRALSYFLWMNDDDLVSLRVRCVVAAMKKIMDEFAVTWDRLTVVGSESGGVVALLAAAVCRDLQKLAIVSSLSSFQSVVEEADYTWTEESFVRGILRHIDLPDIARVLSSQGCKTLIVNPVNGRKMPLDECEARTVYGDEVRVAVAMRGADVAKSILELSRES